jgi:hypothetical protein
LKKLNLIGLTFILGMTLVGCNVTSDTEDDTQDTTEGTIEDTAEDTAEDAELDVVEDNDSNNMVLQTGSTETEIRIVEGGKMEVSVVNYQIEPYNIAYHLDETFGVPKVNDKQVAYSSQEDKYQILLEIIEHTNLETVVSDLQEQFETEGYDEDFGLKDTPPEENDLKGKMQFYDYPVKGFIAYEIDEHVLAITFRYPVEAADGMDPLLESLRKSISAQ